MSSWTEHHYKDTRIHSFYHFPSSKTSFYLKLRLIMESKINLQAWSLVSIYQLCMLLLSCKDCPVFWIPHAAWHAQQFVIGPPCYKTQCNMWSLHTTAFKIQEVCQKPPTDQQICTVLWCLTSINEMIKQLDTTRFETYPLHCQNFRLKNTLPPTTVYVSLQ